MLISFLQAYPTFAHEHVLEGQHTVVIGQLRQILLQTH